MEFREICKQLDTHAGRMMYLGFTRLSIEDMIEFSQITPFFLIKRMWMYPHHQITYSIMCDSLCAPLFRGIRDNVSFLDIVWDETWAMRRNTNVPVMGLYQITSQDVFDAFILSCDWCSFVNGIFHTLTQNIEANPEMLVLLEPYKEWAAHVVKEWMDFDSKFIPTVPQEYASIYDPILRFIAGSRMSLDDAETRWCPFKRAKSAYFRNSDPRFQPLEPDVVLQVGEILAKQRNIMCDECPGIVNSATVFAHDPSRISLIQPMLDFVSETG